MIAEPGRRVTLLDGALGTELSRRGLDTSAPLWSARCLDAHLDVVTLVHREHLRAGADVLTTCTFRTHARSLLAGGWAGRQDELNRRAVLAARTAATLEGARHVKVAGSVAPLEDCWRPDLVPSDADLSREHADQAHSLATAGVDVLLVETMNCRREAEHATAACLATGLPTWCSFASDGRGRLLSGEPLGEAARAVEDLGTEAVLVNCVPTTSVRADLDVLLEACEGPVGIYPNVGHGVGIEGFRPELMLSPEGFAEAMLACAEAGAALVGGCCGTEPRHLAALARRMEEAGLR